MLGAFGQIGTEQAVDVLVAHTKDDRPTVRNAAITRARRDAERGAPRRCCSSSRASAAIRRRAHAIARARRARHRHAPSRALIELASSRRLRDRAAPRSTRSATPRTPAAEAALRKLIDAPGPADRRGRARRRSTRSTRRCSRKLTTIVKSGDPQLVNAALAALAKAGEAALPVLREAALHGAHEHAVGRGQRDRRDRRRRRRSSSSARSSRPAIARPRSAAASALASIGGAEARELLIEAALSDRAQITGALAQLAQMEGEDVDQALLSVDQAGLERRSPRRAAAPAQDRQRRGARSSRSSSRARARATSATRRCACSPTPARPRRSTRSLDIAGKSRGQTRVSALDMLAQSRPADPAVGQLLRDSLFSGRRDEARYAASVLGRIGTEEARQALIAALDRQGQGARRGRRRRARPDRPDRQRQDRAARRPRATTRRSRCRS